VLRSGTSRIDRPGRSGRRSSRCWYSRWRARECRGRLPRRSGPRYATRDTRLAPFFDVDDATARVHMGGRCSGRSRRANITDIVRLNLEPTTQRVNRCHHREPSACATGLRSRGAVDWPVRLDSHAMPSRPSFGTRGGGAGAGGAHGHALVRARGGGQDLASCVDGASAVVQHGKVLEFAIPKSDAGSDSILLLAEWRRRIVSYSTESRRGCAISDRRARANGATR
jgi:hypothetical protein